MQPDEARSIPRKNDQQTHAFAALSARKRQPPACIGPERACSAPPGTPSPRGPQCCVPSPYAREPRFDKRSGLVAPRSIRYRIPLELSKHTPHEDDSQAVSVTELLASSCDTPGRTTHTRFMDHDTARSMQAGESLGSIFHRVRSRESNTTSRLTACSARNAEANPPRTCSVLPLKQTRDSSICG